MHEHRDDRGEGELTLWGLDGQGELPAGQPGARRANVGGTARVMSPRRDQVELCAVDLKSLLAADHPARMVWAGHNRLLLGLHFGECYLCLGSGHVGQLPRFIARKQSLNLCSPQAADRHRVQSTRRVRRLAVGRRSESRLGSPR